MDTDQATAFAGLTQEMGTMYLMVPKIRNGGYIPFFVEAKKRSEAALMNVIQEAYVTSASQPAKSIN